MTTPIPDPSRAALRIAIAAVVLLVAASVCARSTARRVDRTVARVPTATDFAGPLRDEAERLLEGHPALRGVAGTPVCAAAFAGTGEPAGLRRRIAVQAICRELCPVGRVLEQGMATAFPAAVTLVGDGDSWHAVGWEAPTDAHYARDVDALFPSAVREALFDDSIRRAADDRLAERVRARWPGLSWPGDTARRGCNVTAPSGAR